MNAMLEPRMVAARIQPPFVVAGCRQDPASIAASSHGGGAMLAMIYCPLGADRTKPRVADSAAMRHGWGVLLDVKGLGAPIRSFTAENVHIPAAFNAHGLRRERARSLFDRRDNRTHAGGRVLRAIIDVLWRRKIIPNLTEDAPGCLIERLSEGI